ncbi:MAG: hypothetical protein ACRDRX_21945 [Pseudonocardiaceae bacterium]
MIREDRELLTELARINREMAGLALRMMEGSAGIAEQQNYAERLIAAGERLRQRAGGKTGTVIEGDVVADGALRLPELTVEPHREP